MPRNDSAGQGEDGIGRVQRRDDGDRVDHVCEHVAADDRSRPAPSALARLDVRLLAHREHGVPHDAEVLRDVDDRDGDGGGEHPASDRGRKEECDDDRQEQVREGEDRVVDQYEDPVQPSPEVPGDEPERDTDHDGEQEGEHDDLDRGARPEDDTGVDVLGDDRRAQPVSRRRRGLLGEPDAVRHVLVEPVGSDLRRRRRRARRRTA